MDVYPSLTYHDVKAALEYLHAAFGLEPIILERDTEGEIRAAAVRHGRGMIMVQPELPADLHGEHVGRGWIYVVVEDPDAHYARAKAAGADVLGVPHEAFEGSQHGYSARDNEGNLWSFGNSRPEDEAQRKSRRH